MSRSKTRCIGILTSGGDCPGLNAAIRAVVKPALSEYGMRVVGILDGFRGLVENRTIPLDDQAVSGILTTGGTLLGTSRDKPHKMPIAGKVMDMTEAAIHNYHRLHMDCLVCLGGGGTQKNALHLHRAGGINVVTLPKTIDNDLPVTDVSFGFDTAMGIATEAIDRLHTTATSHHRMIVCEVMGHNAGWLALGAGIAGGADAILIPEIPYDPDGIAEHLLERRRNGKRFSIIAVAEGAVSRAEAKRLEQEEKQKEKDKKKGKKEKKHEEESELTRADDQTEEDIHTVEEPKASRLARELQKLVGAEARVTNLGHVQRGGAPSAADRLLCTTLGVAAARALADGEYNVMIAVKGDHCERVPLQDVAGRRKIVPPDHEWLDAARLVGTFLGR
jgi:6-phosphofructokinase 1